MPTPSTALRIAAILSALALLSGYIVLAQRQANPPALTPAALTVAQVLASSSKNALVSLPVNGTQSLLQSPSPTDRLENPATLKLQAIELTTPTLPLSDEPVATVSPAPLISGSKSGLIAPTVVSGVLSTVRGAVSPPPIPSKSFTLALPIQQRGLPAAPTPPYIPPGTSKTYTLSFKGQQLSIPAGATPAPLTFPITKIVPPPIDSPVPGPINPVKLP